jgi:serine/threonine protein kinase
MGNWQNAMLTSPEMWESVKSLFDAALELHGEDRRVFLEHCTDINVRQEVERLLNEYECASGFLSDPVLVKNTPDQEPKAKICVGEILANRFRILKFIASGGMGDVYEAEDQELHEFVAIKTIRPDILAATNAVSRFKREVYLARKVTHPNVCRIFDIFRHGPSAMSVNEIVFISMELLRGRTLADQLRENGPFTPVEALPLIQQMSTALAAAHKVGIVHRDFKPGNVVLDSGSNPKCPRAVITDFGLALQYVQTRGGPLVSSIHAFAGTPAYMAPEQLEGKPTSSATDIYALGLVIYEMVTNNRPFRGDTPMSGAVKRLSEAPPSPRVFSPGLSSAWESTILKCLERDPAKRPVRAEEVAAALIGDGTLILRRPQQRRISIIAAVTICALGGILGFVVHRNLLGHSWRIVTTTAQPQHRKSVAVLGFRNLSGSKDRDWISTALAEELTSELSAGEKLRTVPEEEIARMEDDFHVQLESLGRDTLSRD